MDKLTISTAIYRAATPETLEELRTFGNAGPIADAVIAAIHESGVSNKPLNAATMHLAAKPRSSPLLPQKAAQALFEHEMRCRGIKASWSDVDDDDRRGWQASADVVLALTLPARLTEGEVA